MKKLLMTLAAIVSISSPAIANDKIEYKDLFADVLR